MQICCDIMEGNQAVILAERRRQSAEARKRRNLAPAAADTLVLDERQPIAATSVVSCTVMCLVRTGPNSIFDCPNTDILETVKINMPKRCIIVHPLLFALFPVLSLYVRNADRLQLREALGAILIVPVAASSLWLLLRLILKDNRRSAIIVSVLLIVFFSYSHAVRASAILLYQAGILDNVGVHLVFASRIALAWLLFLAVLLAAVCYLTARSSSSFRGVTATLNMISLCLVTIIAANMAITRPNAGQGDMVDSNKPGAARTQKGDSRQQGRSAEEGAGASSVSNPLPDIYYIILDGYARADILEQLYGLDGSEIFSDLTERGFYVADQSRSNYCQTTLSLASSLNLTYLDDLASRVGSDSSSFAALDAMIENSLLVRSLRTYGYTIWAFSTGYSPTEIASADSYLSPPRSLNSFQNELINTTPLTLLSKIQYRLHRERILYTLDHLVDAARVSSPIFVIAHVIAPHPPFVFGANGEPRQPDLPFTLMDGTHFMMGSTKEEYTTGYRDQLAFITARLLDAVDQILLRSPEPPIIVLQSDHGPGSMLDWNSVHNAYLPERFSILSAYYFPDQRYQALYPGITPVNSFRVILDQYFGMDYQILDDRSYYSNPRQPYLFVDVTDELLADSPQ
jgi:hypothetical protein